MTSKSVEISLKRRGFEVDPEFELNNGVLEFMREDWYPHHPLEKPLVYQTEEVEKYFERGSMGISTAAMGSKSN